MHIKVLLEERSDGAPQNQIAHQTPQIWFLLDVKFVRFCSTVVSYKMSL